MKQRGFTLIEMAIVLVIFGLILGGILNARGLIGSTQAKDVIAIVDDLRTATAYFKQRYNYLPGDWPYTANEIPGVTAATTVGTNGDGAIDGAIDTRGWAQLGSEVAEAPLQLFSAGFISKIDVNDAPRRIKTTFGAVHVASSATVGDLVPGFAGANPAVRNAIVFYNLPCNIVMEVDSKIDNGVTILVDPATGNAGGRAFGTGCTRGDDNKLNGPVLWYAVAL